MNKGATTVPLHLAHSIKSSNELKSCSPAPAHPSPGSISNVTPLCVCNMFALTRGGEGRLVSLNLWPFSLLALRRLGTIYGSVCWSEMKEPGIYDTYGRGVSGRPGRRRTGVGRVATVGSRPWWKELSDSLLITFWFCVLYFLQNINDAVSDADKKMRCNKYHWPVFPPG